MRRFFYLSPLALQTLIWPIVRPMFRFFLRLEVRGLDSLPSCPRRGAESARRGGGSEKIDEKRSGVIFAVNHSSELDAILVPASLPFLSPFSPMFYTSREQSFYKNSGWRKQFYGGLFFKLWGSHRLHSGHHDYATSLQTHIQILKDGKSLLMFPDGKRLPESDIGTIAHGGVGYLALATGAVVIPVRITGAYRMSLADFFLRRRRVKVIFGASEPRSATGSLIQPTVPECKEFSRAVMQKVRSLMSFPQPAIDRKVKEAILTTD